MTVLTTLTVPWIPLQHRMDVVLTPHLPEAYSVTTAFVLALDADHRTLLTHVNRPNRGWEIPGGHLDPGESPLAAAVRELAEESGLSVDPKDLTLLGGLQITLAAPPPPTYTYPAQAFMAYYALRLPTRGAATTPHPTSECTEAAWVDSAQLDHHCPTAPWRPLHATLTR
ncbi:NUDIX hydrolase [Streptacidiphilus sp. PAMC 29251]